MQFYFLFLNAFLWSCGQRISSRFLLQLHFLTTVYPGSKPGSMWRSSWWVKNSLKIRGHRPPENIKIFIYFFRPPCEPARPPQGPHTVVDLLQRLRRDRLRAYSRARSSTASHTFYLRPTLSPPLCAAQDLKRPPRCIGT